MESALAAAVTRYNTTWSMKELFLNSGLFEWKPMSFDVEFDEATLGPQGWFEKNMRNGALIGLTVYYDTPDPGATGWWYAKYRVHWLGDEPGWGKWEIDDEDDGAGNDCDQVDMIELTIVRC